MQKKPGHYWNNYRQLKREKNQIRSNTNSADNTNNSNGSAQTNWTNSKPNYKVSNNTNANKTHIQRDRRSRPVSHPVRPVVELTTPQRNVTLEQTQQTDRVPGIDDRKDKTKSNAEMLRATQMGMSKLQPKL